MRAKFLFLAMIILAAALAIPACVTVRTPDGTSTTRVDTEALAQSIILAEQGLALAQQAVEMYQALHPEDGEASTPDADLARLQDRIDYWALVLQRLYATYATLTAAEPTPLKLPESPPAP